MEQLFYSYSLFFGEKDIFPYNTKDTADIYMED